jgi:DNA-binding XRE family transcriptional regulator
MKKRTRITRRPENFTEVKSAFFSDLQQNRLSLAEAIHRMREITGKTQQEYALLVDVAPRVIIDLERGIGNPTLETLEKIGRPFGLSISFSRPKRTSQ